MPLNRERKRLGNWAVQLALPSIGCTAHGYVAVAWLALL